MPRKFETESRKAVAAAREIASELESPTLEAEHLLLALARQPATTAHDLLVEAGLDYDQLRAALDAEFEGTLAAVGITLSDFDLSATASRTRIPRWGASAKLVLERSVKIADGRRDRRITPGHILLGILRAVAGTVPRALDRAGVDRAELSSRVAAAL
jgi:ATP-dependent Clp protease ATP-binding subunit ClpA